MPFSSAIIVGRTVARPLAAKQGIMVESIRAIRTAHILPLESGIAAFWFFRFSDMFTPLLEILRMDVRRGWMQAGFCIGPPRSCNFIIQDAVREIDRTILHFGGIFL